MGDQKVYGIDLIPLIQLSHELQLESYKTS